jgi:hypothetical protein
MRFEERMKDFVISLINQVDYEVKPLTAMDRAKRIWKQAGIVERKDEDASTRRV